MQEKLFRKKSVDRMKSPEDLNDYIKISGFGIKFLLIGILIFLVAGCVVLRGFLFN